MKSIRKYFMNESVDFYQLLKEQSEITCQGVSKLNEFCEFGNQSVAEEIVDIERKGDLIRKKLIEGINGTFITPLEREDLYNLSRSIDNILDYSRTTAERIIDFNVEINSTIKLLVAELYEMAKLLVIAISHLENDNEKTTEAAIKIKKIENKIELYYRQAVAKLFDIDDVKEILKNREIYRHLSNAADKGDEVADELCQIVIKSA